MVFYIVCEMPEVLDSTASQAVINLLPYTFKSQQLGQRLLGMGEHLCLCGGLENFPEVFSLIHFCPGIKALLVDILAKETHLLDT